MLRCILVRGTCMHLMRGQLNGAHLSRNVDHCCDATPCLDVRR
jgi:hypothetical protein